MSSTSPPIQPFRRGRPRRAWQVLTAPSPAVLERGARERAQILASVLLGLVPAAAIGFGFAWSEIGTVQPSLAAATGLLLVAYGLSRSRFATSGALLTLVALSLPSFSIVISGEVGVGRPVEYALSWLALPLVLGALVLRTRQAIAWSAALLLAVLTLPYLGATAITDLVGSASLLFVIALLSVATGAALRSHQVRIARELADRKRAEVALQEAKDRLEVEVLSRTADLREANERLRILIRSSPAAVVVLDEDLKVAAWNAAAEHLLGWQEHEVLGKAPPFASWDFHDGDRAGLDTPGLDAEIVLRRKDDSFVEALLRTARIRAPERSMAGLIAVLLDVTERHRLEEQLREAQKMEAIGRLAGGVAHEFNNLLLVINGYTECALSSIAESTPLSEDLAEVHRAGRRAAAITRQLLALGRKQLLRPQVVDLNDLIERMGKALAQLVPEDVRLLMQLDPGLSRVRADPGQVEQVVLNLVLNAVDAMPEGGELVLETTGREVDKVGGATAIKPGSYAALVVRDTGVGMGPELLSHVFEPFYTTRETGQGTGLGLPTVHGIVRQSGGWVGVDSAPGLGTAVTVLLPGTDEYAAEGPHVAEDTPRGGHETVLVVEDEAPVLQLASRTLRELGYRVVEAQDGHAALERCADLDEALDLVVADVVMPGIGGVECVRRLRQVQPELRSLFITGHAESLLQQRGVQVDELNVLHKPFSATDLANRVRSLLDTPPDGEASHP